MCSADKDFIAWHDSQIVMALEQFLDHLGQKKCIVCMDKHLTMAEAYAMENASFTGSIDYLNLARSIRELRKMPTDELMALQPGEVISRFGMLKKYHAHLISTKFKGRVR